MTKTMKNDKLKQRIVPVKIVLAVFAILLGLTRGTVNAQTIYAFKSNNNNAYFAIDGGTFGTSTFSTDKSLLTLTAEQALKFGSLYVNAGSDGELSLSTSASTMWTVNSSNYLVTSDGRFLFIDYDNSGRLRVATTAYNQFVAHAFTGQVVWPSTSATAGVPTVSCGTTTIGEGTHTISPTITGSYAPVITRYTLQDEYENGHILVKDYTLCQYQSPTIDDWSTSTFADPTPISPATCQGYVQSTTVTGSGEGTSWSFNAVSNAITNNNNTGSNITLTVTYTVAPELSCYGENVTTTCTLTLLPLTPEVTPPTSVSIGSAGCAHPNRVTVAGGENVQMRFSTDAGSTWSSWQTLNALNRDLEDLVPGTATTVVVEARSESGGNYSTAVTSSSHTMVTPAPTSVCRTSSASGLTVTGGKIGADVYYGKNTLTPTAIAAYRGTTVDNGSGKATYTFPVSLLEGDELMSVRARYGSWEWSCIDSLPHRPTYSIDCNTLTLACVSSDATIYYTMTTDGTEPADPEIGASGVLTYSAPITLTADSRLKVAAARSDGSCYRYSNAVEVMFQFRPQTPAISSDGYYVTMTSSSDVYYTTGDDSPNTSTWTLYVGAIVGVEGATYRAVGYNSANGTFSCSEASYSFTMVSDLPTIKGNVYGGGRVANVNGSSLVTIVGCKDEYEGVEGLCGQYGINEVFGGNDIAGQVLALTPNANGNYGTEVVIGTDETAHPIRIKAVYGGGNGYYQYGGNRSVDAADNASISLVDGVQTVTENTVVTDYLNGTDEVITLDSASPVPTSVRTYVTIGTNNATNTAPSGYEYIDSVFGGAKNAYITATSGNSTSVTFNGGSVYSVFGGNNVGGSLGAGSSHLITINGTKVNNASSLNMGEYAFDETTCVGMPSHGIRYLFGGGNKIEARSVVMNIYGGQIDTCFAGGNAASVEGTTVTVNIGSQAGMSNESLYPTYDPSAVVYDIRCLFGGNNQANMTNGLPTLNLIRGGIHNVYGGGNVGEMQGFEAYVDNVNIEQGGAFATTNNSYRSTKVIVSSDDMVCDTIYGGGQKAGTLYDTYVEISAGNVGTVFGGTNIQGTIPQTSTSPGSLTYTRPKSNVYVHGGTVHEAVFGGSNGYYRCIADDGLTYSTSSVNVLFDKTSSTDDDNLYAQLRGETIPYIWTTDVLVAGNAQVNGSVYAGGNIAPIGNKTTNDGMAKVHVVGGTIGQGTGSGSSAKVTNAGYVYGGGNMADVYGINDLIVTGGTIYGDVYGGNDKMGSIAGTGRTGTSTVAEADGNAVLQGTITGGTSSITLTAANASSYILIEGTPNIAGSVYGGGNGDYNYYSNYHEITTPNLGGKEDVVGCTTNSPVQNSAFVDIHIGKDASDNYGYINRVFGGGNSATVSSSATVWFNCDEWNTTSAQVGAIFGGNNLVNMTALPEIVMLQGTVGTLYGGGNQGSMTGGASIMDPITGQGVVAGTFIGLNSNNVRVKKNVYGGCNAADVANMAYCYITKGTIDGRIFGGNDASGEVSTSEVYLIGDASSDLTVNSVYGGGNGDYAVVEETEGGIPTGTYTVRTSDDYENESGVLNVTLTGQKGRPYVESANVLVQGKVTVNGNLYGGGISGDCGETNVTIDAEQGVFEGIVFGGGQGRVKNIGIRGYCKNYTGVARKEGSAIVYGSSTAMGNVLGKAHLTISRVGEMRGRGTFFGGGHAGDVKGVELNLENTVTAHINSIYLGCLASNVVDTAYGVFNAYSPVDGKPLIDTIYGGNDFTGLCNHTVMDVNSGIYQFIFGAGNGNYLYKEYLETKFGSDASDISLINNGQGSGSDWRQCADTVPYNMTVDMTINGGTFLDNIYGGGNLGLVGNRDLDPSNIAESDIGHIVVNVHGGHVGRHIFTGACGRTDMRGWYFLGGVNPNNNVYKTIDYNSSTGEGKLLGKQLAYATKVFNMDSGVVDFSVYGGSEAVDDGFPFECIDSSYNRTTHTFTQSTLRPSTIMNITGGIIDKSVYGGGYQGNIYGSIYMNIGADAVNDSPVWTYPYRQSLTSNDTIYFAQYKPTLAVGTPVTLGASVYNGSDWGEAGATAYFYTRGVYGGVTNILIDGKGYNTSLVNTAASSMPGMDIHNSIYGAGTSTEGGDINRLITIRHYGDYFCPEPSKTLLSIQRADKTILDSVFLTLTGERDAYSSYESPNYSFCRIDTLIFRIDNIIVINAPSVFIGNLVSLKDYEVYDISNTTHWYTNDVVDGVSVAKSENVANDLYDNLLPEDDGSGICADDNHDGYLDACEELNVCDKLPTERGEPGRPGAFNVLMMNNGSYVRVSPFIDERDTNTHTAGHDHLDDANEHWGHVFGYMYLLAQDNTQSYVYSHANNMADSFTNDGGFIATCSCENLNTALYDNEIGFTNVTSNNHSYRTWRVGSNEGVRTRHITLVGNANPDNMLNYRLSTGNYRLTTNSSGEAASTLSSTKMAYAKATLELPPSNSGNFYIINSVLIDQDNGGQLQLVDQGYISDNVFFGFDTLMTTTRQPLAIESIIANPNYTFGLTFTNGNYMQNSCWNDGTLPITSITAAGETRNLVDENGVHYDCWPSSLVSGNSNLTQNGGYISTAVDGVGVIPTLDFTLTYNTDITTTVTRDVVFTLYEFDQNGDYVGPVEVTVTISTVISIFDDLDAPLLAMYNEGVRNEYVRSVTIPASFHQRDIFLTGIEWHINPACTTGSLAAENSTHFHMQSQGTIPDNKHFSIRVKPTENISENTSNALGWYAIKDSFDIYKTAAEAYQYYTGTTSNPDEIVYNSADASIVRRSGEDYSELTMAEAIGQTGQTGYKTDQGLWIGTLDGRSSAAMEIALDFDGMLYYYKHYTGNDPGPLAYATLTFKYMNTKTMWHETITEEQSGYFHINILLRTRDAGDTIYLSPTRFTRGLPTGATDSITLYSYETQKAAANMLGLTMDDDWNSNLSFAATCAAVTEADITAANVYSSLSPGSTDAMRIYNNPDFYLRSIEAAMRIYREGDVLDIIKTIPIVPSSSTTLNFGGDESFPVQIIRYSGSHYTFPTAGCALYDAMLDINGGRVSMHDVWLNGSGCTRQKAPCLPASDTLGRGGITCVGSGASAVYYCEKYPRTRTLLFANAPMISCHDGGNITFIRNVRMSNNFNKAQNSSSDFIGGGALSVVAGTVGKANVVFGTGTHIYDNAVVDWNASTQSQPLNYGGGIYIDGGTVTFGIGSTKSSFDISRNYYLRNVTSLMPATPNQADTAALFSRLFQSVDNAIATGTFQTYAFDTAAHTENFSLSNVYLKRTPWAEPSTCSESTDATIAHHAVSQLDQQSDIVFFNNEMTDGSRIGISKWFPGYVWGTSGDELFQDVPRDTIRFAKAARSNVTLVDRVYNTHAFFNDSSFYSDVTDHKFTSEMPQVLYNNNTHHTTSNTNYNDNVWIFYHSTINPYEIYFQRCATFGKGIIPSLDQTTCDGRKVKILNTTDTLYYRWNPDATCMASTDTLFYHVGGGFFPYTYSWADSTTTVSEIRKRLTLGTNMATSADPNLATRAQCDTLKMSNLNIPHSDLYRDFIYQVTASDLTDHCILQQPVMIRSIKARDAETYADIDRSSKSYDDDGFLTRGTSYSVAVPGVDSIGEYHLQTPRYLRTFHSYTVTPQIYPVAAQGTVTGHDDFNDVNLHLGDDLTSEEFCPGDIIRLVPSPNTTSGACWELVGWNFDPSGTEQPNFVVTSEWESNHPTVYYAPCDYWWQTVTTQPSSYVVDYYGNVDIYDNEGLAWLISTINGYNGQNAQTFRFNTITLHPVSGGYDMGAHKWTPLGNLTNNFEGVFKGEGDVVIKNLRVNESTTPRVGMFGYVESEHAEISDFSIEDALLKGNTYVGGVVAHADNKMKLSNTTIRTSTLFGQYCISALVAKAEGGSKITSNHVSSVDLIGNAIYASHGVGDATSPVDINNNAIVYRNVYDTTMSNTRYLSNIYYNQSYIYYGGLLAHTNGNNRPNGKSANRITVNNNYVQVPNGTAQRLGGLVGYATQTDLNNNYIYGEAKATNYAGGLVAFWDEDVNVSNCYYESSFSNDAVGFNAYGDLPVQSTTFSGHGNQVLLTEHVGGYTNLTRALNKWVDAQDDTTYYHWRSDSDNQNNGYPVFGDPELIYVYDTLMAQSCETFDFDGLTFTESGTYVFHVVDSSDYLDSTFSLILTVNYGDSVAVVDSVVLGNDYEGFGFQLSADEVRQAFRSSSQTSPIRTYLMFDYQVNGNGCDSIVSLTLYIVDDGTPVPPAIEQMNDIVVYPNPTRGIIHVEGDNMIRIDIYDQMSRTVDSRILSNATSTADFDLSNLPAGSYFVRVRTNLGSVVKKVIKK